MKAQVKQRNGFIVSRVQLHYLVYNPRCCIIRQDNATQLEPGTARDPRTAAHRAAGTDADAGMSPALSRQLPQQRYHDL